MQPAFCHGTPACVSFNLSACRGCIPHFGTCHGAPFVDLVSAAYCLCKEKHSEVQEVQLFKFSLRPIIQIVFAFVFVASNTFLNA